MCTSQGILPDPRNQLLIDLFPIDSKKDRLSGLSFFIQKSRRTEAASAECPRLCQRESCPVIDHFSGSGYRYPDRAVWRTLPAKILPVCGTRGRCENQRSEASSRLRRPGCLSFAGVFALMCSSQKAGRRAKGDTGMQKSGAEVCPPPAPFGVFVFTGVFARMCSSQKNWQENQGGYGNAESGAEVCPPPALSRVFAFTGVPAYMRFSAQKNPPAGKPGDFYQAFAVRWVFSRAITTGGISTS